MQESPCDSQAGGLSARDEPARVWLAAYTRPRHEATVKRYCDDRGVETFLPLRRSLRCWSDRRKLMKLPLFPSYVFVHVGTEERARVVCSPGLLWFVGDRSGPTPVDRMELSAVRLLLDSDWEFDPLLGVVAGDAVEVTHGALRGCSGILERKSANGVVLRVTAIGCAVRVQVPDASWIQAQTVRAGMRAAAS